MFTEIKLLKEAKKILFEEYKKNSVICPKEDLEYMVLKYKHSYDCLRILKEIKPTKYFKFASAILLHDIGRFSEYKKIKNFKHEQYGYNLLNNNYLKNPLILFSVKYHEDGLDWLVKLKEEKQFLKYNKILKNEIINCCQIVREIDVISNMKSILKCVYSTKIDSINYELIKVFRNGELSNKEMIRNDYDKILYILCGLSIISDKNSFKYLKKYKIVDKLMDNLFFLIKEENIKLKKETKEIKDFIYEKYNL